MSSPRAADLLFSQLAAAGHASERPWGVDHESAAVPVRNGEVHPRELAEAARRLARTVAAHGVAGGDRIVVRLDTPLDVLVAVAGLTAIGAVPVLLSPRLEWASARAALEPVEGPAHVLVTRSRAAEFTDGWEGEGRRLVWEDVTGDGASAHVPPDAPEPAPDGVERAPDEPYLVTHTSGTTGVPKLVVHTRDSFFQQAAIQARMLGVMRIKGYLAAAISPVHVRTLSGVLAALRLRHSLVLLASEAPDSVEEQLRRWRPEYLETHPNSLVTWEELARSGAVSSVRLFLGTFDAVHPRTVDAMLAGSRRRLAVFTEVYAQSELGPIAFRLRSRRLGRSRRDVGVSLSGHPVGRPLPGYSKVRIVDDAGRPVRRGEPGRIQVRSQGRFAGYLNAPERFTENLSEDGWWDSGDWGARSASGALRLLDRQVERLNHAPSGIALEDVLLERVPEVAEVVVLETDGTLQPVVACRDGARVSDVRWTAAVSGLPPLAAPRFVAWDEIPRTATGKVRREVLRRHLAVDPQVSG